MCIRTSLNAQNINSLLANSKSLRMIGDGNDGNNEDFTDIDNKLVITTTMAVIVG